MESEIARELPLTEPEYCTLMTLAGGEMHGYGVIQAVSQATGGSVQLRTGTLYVVLRRLAERGLIAESDGRPRRGEDARRRYYGITDRGLAVVRAEAERLAAMAALAASRGLLAGG